MARRRRGTQRIGWSDLRPVLVAFLLVADAFVVAALVLSRREGWLPPFVAFGSVLVGLVWLLGWSLRHRGEDK